MLIHKLINLIMEEAITKNINKIVMIKNSKSGLFILKATAIV